MTEEAQRIAIAEFRGWVWYRIPHLPSDGDRRHRCLFLPALHEYEGQSERWLVRADGTERVCNLRYMETEGHLPKLDLDEIHEAEILLTREQQTTHMDNLVSEDSHLADMLRELCFATPAKRAEALLRTIGKWVEA